MLGTTRRKDYDWRADALANRPDHVRTVHSWKAEIEQYQVGSDTQAGVERFLPGRGGVDAKPVSAQVGLHNAQDGRLVVDNQDAGASAVTHAAETSVVGEGPVSDSSWGKVKTKRAP